MKSSGALTITVVLVFLFIFCLEMPGNWKWLGVLALVLNVRWWRFVTRDDSADGPSHTK